MMSQEQYQEYIQQAEEKILLFLRTFEDLQENMHVGKIPEAQAIPDYPDYPASTAPLAPQALKGRAAPRASEDLPDQPALRELPVPHIR